MLKLIKFLKPFALSVLAIIVFLFLQAYCDLSLPDYTSKIVNVGIQQKGIEDAVPTVIRESELAKLKLFMNSSEVTKLNDSYKLLSKDTLSDSQYKSYLKKYQKLKSEPLYELKSISDKKRDSLNSIMGKAELIVSEVQKNGLTPPKQQTANTKMESNPQMLPTASQVPGKKLSPFDIISKLPSDNIKALKKQLNSQISKLPGTMITQAAVSYVNNEYKSIGINSNNLQTNYLLSSGGLMLLLALLSMISTIIVGYMGSKVAGKLSRNLRQEVFTKVINFSNSEFDKFSTASLITRSTNDIQQIQSLMVMLIRIVFYAPLLAIGGIIKVVNSNASMAWTIGVAIAAILIVVIALFGIAIPKFKSVQKLVDKLNLVTREFLSGILVIRAFNTQKHAEEKFDIANNNLTKTNLFVNRIMSLMMPCMMLIMNATTLLIVFVGAHRVNNGAMQVGDMMAYIQYAMQIIMAFLMLSMVSVMLPRAAVSAERIGEVLDSDISVKDLNITEKLSQKKKGYIEFRNVSFKYPGADDNALSGITFTAKPGETTAFIGSTGSGKTTLVNLIPRFYDVSSGEVLVDGVNVSKANQHELREKIGYVPQKAVLFSGDIESNIKYGAQNASNEELTASARIAQAMEFINQKPEGFKSEISQGGANVSGGQKQRLSIARAIAKKPEIYVFDDSFSALDLKTDAALRKALKNEVKNSTVLIVAQRISTIMNADQIVVLDEGKVAGMGTHEELMKNCEVYQQIAISQLSKEELANE